MLYSSKSSSSLSTPSKESASDNSLSLASLSTPLSSWQFWQFTQPQQSCICSLRTREVSQVQREESSRESLVDHLLISSHYLLEEEVAIVEISSDSMQLLEDSLS